MLNKPWIDPRNVDWTDSLNPLAQSFTRWDVNPWFNQTMRDPLWQAIRSARNLEPRLLVAPDIGGLILTGSLLTPMQTVDTSFTQMEPNSWLLGFAVNNNGSGFYLQITDSETGKTLYDVPRFFNVGGAGSGPILLDTPWGFVPPSYPIVKLINADNAGSTQVQVVLYTAVEMDLQP